MPTSLIYDNDAAEDKKEQIYAAIKHMVMTHQIAAGSRINLVTIADQLGVSNTPVREVLARLAAEQLIEERYNAGFFTKKLSEAEIAGVYKASGILVDDALAIISDPDEKIELVKPPDRFEIRTPLGPLQATDLIGDLFIHIVRQCRLHPFVPMMMQLNARCYFVRLKECELFPRPTIGEAIRLFDPYYDSNIYALRHELRGYIDRRIAILPELLQAIRQAWRESSAERGPSQLTASEPDTPK